MSAWPEGWPWWIAGAIGIFWLIGAHNRLVRLRSAARQAFAVLDAALVRQLEYVQGRAAADADAGTPAPMGDASAPAALQAALHQLTALLAATRARPFAPGAMPALATALHVLLAAWQRLHPDEVLVFDTDGTLSRPTPLEREAEPVASADPAARGWAWAEPSAAAEIARGQFNRAVAQYNREIARFPAWLVARAFRLRPGTPLV